MECKIGEIRKVNEEWYQCLEEKTCTCFGCDFRNYNCDDISLKEVKGSCQSERRKDNKSVIFKKLEKVGEPIQFGNKIMQRYKVFIKPYVSKALEHFNINSTRDLTILIEIKEDMEIDKVVMNIDDRDYLLDRLEAILHDTHCQQYKDEICEAFSKYIFTETAYGLKPFDLNAAKAGKPVCTRDGRKARIICFDKEGSFQLVVLITRKEDLIEDIRTYSVSGISSISYNRRHPEDHNDDLMMLPEKKEGWIIVSKNATIYDSLEDVKKIL